MHGEYEMQLKLPEDGQEQQGVKGRKRPRRVLPYSDIDLSRWKEYPEVWTDSLWMVQSRARGNGHSLDYYGNFVPQIATQIFERSSKAGDIALAMFLGSGTSAIEAVNMGRRLIGVEISPVQAESVRQKMGPAAADLGIHVIQGDSTSRRTLRPIRSAIEAEGRQHVQLLMLHPPYHDIIQFTTNEHDLSNAPTTADFLRGFRRTARMGYELLEPGRFAALVIGDKYADRELVPLGFLTMQEMNRVGFRTKSIVVKNMVGNERGKGKAANLWRYRALAGGFYIFRHEYVILFQKD